LPYSSAGGKLFLGERALALGALALVLAARRQSLAQSLSHCSIDWIQGTKSSSTKQSKSVGLLLASLNHTLHNYATGFGQLAISH
jgi:hypothetical protein